MTGLFGSSSIVDYSMTKGGIHAFTRALSGSLDAARNPRERRRARPGLDAALNPSDDAKKAETFGAGTPMKRPAQPEELAPAYALHRRGM